MRAVYLEQKYPHQVEMSSTEVMIPYRGHLRVSQFSFLTYEIFTYL